MRVYCTCKNTGPSWGMDPVTMLYLGTSEHEAIQAAENFHKYEQLPERFPKEFIYAYSAIPADVEREMIKFYGADGWWYSIVMFDLN